jgi:hypothetical protein
VLNAITVYDRGACKKFSQLAGLPFRHMVLPTITARRSTLDEPSQFAKVVRASNEKTRVRILNFFAVSVSLYVVAFYTVTCNVSSNETHCKTITHFVPGVVFRKI